MTVQVQCTFEDFVEAVAANSVRVARRRQRQRWLGTVAWIGWMILAVSILSLGLGAIDRTFRKALADQLHAAARAMLPVIPALVVVGLFLLNTFLARRAGRH